MEVSATQYLIAMVVIVALIIGIIFALRYFMRPKPAESLAGEHGEDHGLKFVKHRVKYAEVDGFRFRSPLILFGLALSLFLVLLTISWTRYEKPVFIPDDAMLIDETIEIEPPRTAEPPPPPPPPPPPVIEEVPEEELLEEEQPVFMDQTVEEQTVIQERPVEPRPAPPPPPPPPKDEPDEIFRVVEQMPRFPGCENEPGGNEEKRACAEKKMLEYIYRNVRYPAIARENGIQGRVVVQFVVERDGTVTDIQVVRDIGAGCGEEAARVVRSMNNMPERWTPGRQRGQPVRVQFTLPVQFRLE